MTSACVLLVFLYLCQLSCGQGSGGYDDGEGSGSGSGSGSGDDMLDVRCRRPPNLQKINKTRYSELQLLTVRMTCHVACIEKVNELTNSTINVSKLYPIWPMVSDSVLEQNCDSYQQVQACREGCVERRRIRTLELCSRSCLDKCNNACGGLNDCEQSETVCRRTCSADLCEMGCSTYVEITSLEDPTRLPIMPRSAPLFEIPPGIVRAGHYLINPRNTSLGLVNSSILSLSTFLVRVIYGNSITYYWLPSLDTVLDLQVYSCKEDIRVQYRAVNKYGLSSLSDTTTIPAVYGESGVFFPDNPEDDLITFKSDADTRFGYWKHVIIHMTWQRPRGYGFLDYYAIRLSPMIMGGACGHSEQVYHSSRAGTMATLKASNPREGLIINCDYRISITSIPTLGSPMPAIDRIYRVEDISNPVPLNYSCNHTWNVENGTFQFSPSWLLPNSTHLLDAITSFQVTVHLIIPGRSSGSGTRNSSWSTTVAFNRSDLEYRAVVGPFTYSSDPEAYYNVQLSTTPRSPSDLLLTPDSRQCSFSAIPLPPDPVFGLQIDANVTRYTSFDPSDNVAELTVGVSWMVGGASLEYLKGYQVRLVEMEAVDEGQSVGEEFAKEDVSNSSRMSHQFMAEVPADMPSGSCFFVQVRSISIYGAMSSWSSAKCINTTYLGDLQSLLLTTTVTTTSTTTVETSGDFYVFVAVGAGTGSVVMAALIVITLVLILATRRKKYWITKESSLRRGLSPSKESINDYDIQLQDLSSSWKGQAERSKSLSPDVMEMEWEIHPRQVVVETRLGQGTFGDVYTGVLLGGAVGGARLSTPRKYLCQNAVAIQMLPSTASPAEEQAFFSCIEQAKLVAQKQSTCHIVELIGCVTHNKPLSLIQELPVNGDLLTYLVMQRNKLTGDLIKGSQDGIPSSQSPLLVQQRRLMASDLFGFSVQIALGMESLASLGIVHGDLACRNVYLDGQGVVKITDFGIRGKEKTYSNSRIYPSTEFGRRPLKWLSPEAIVEGTTTVASDVWAFGITLWEIVTLGGYPYNNIRNKEVLQHLLTGNRLQQPINCSTNMYELMLFCWRQNPHKRPNFLILHDTLNDLSSSGDSISLNINPDCPYYRLHGGKKEPGQRRKQHQGEELHVVLEEEVEEEGEGQEEEEGEETVCTVVLEAAASRNSTGNYEHQLPKIDESMEEDGTEEGKDENEAGETDTALPSSSPSDEGLPQSPLAGRLGMVLLPPVDTGADGKLAFAQIHRVDEKREFESGDRRGSKDSASDEGIASPSVSPIEDSPDHCMVNLGNGDGLEEIAC